MPTSQSPRKGACATTHTLTLGEPPGQGHAQEPPFGAVVSGWALICLDAHIRRYGAWAGAGNRGIAMGKAGIALVAVTSVTGRRRAGQ